MQNISYNNILVACFSSKKLKAELGLPQNLAWILNGCDISHSNLAWILNGCVRAHMCAHIRVHVRVHMHALSTGTFGSCVCDAHVRALTSTQVGTHAIDGSSCRTTSHASARTWHTRRHIRMHACQARTIELNLGHVGHQPVCHLLDHHYYFHLFV